MKPDAYGRCRHSMVISLRSSGVPVWPDRDGIVQAHCSLLSSRGDPEQSGSRTPRSPLLPPARQKDPNPLQTHTALSEGQSNFSSDSCHFRMDY